MKTNNMLLVGGIALIYLAYKLNKKRKENILVDKSFNDSQEQNVYDSMGRLVKCVNAPCYDFKPNLTEDYNGSVLLTGALK